MDLDAAIPIPEALVCEIRLKPDGYSEAMPDAVPGEAGRRSDAKPDTIPK